MLNNISIEPVYCSHFGCGRVLSLEEGLRGNKCFRHMVEVKIDPTKIISGKY